MANEEEQNTAYRQQLTLNKLRSMVPYVNSNISPFLKKSVGVEKMKEYHKTPVQPGMKWPYATQDLSAICSMVFDGLPTSLKLAVAPHIINVYSTWNTGLININTEALAHTLPGYNALQNIKRFAAARIPTCSSDPFPSSVVHHIFVRSGRVISSGAKTVASALQAAWELALCLRKLGMAHCILTNYNVSNIVTSMKCDFHIHLVQMLGHYKNQVTYKPSRFPALFFHSEQVGKSVVFYFYPGGEIVVSGVRDQSDLPALSNTAYEIAKSFSSTESIVKRAIEEFKDNNEHIVEDSPFARARDVSIVYSAGSIGSIVVEHRTTSDAAMKLIQAETFRQACQNTLEYGMQYRLGMGKGTASSGAMAPDASADLPDFDSAEVPTSSDNPVVVFDSDSEDSDEEAAEEAVSHPLLTEEDLDQLWSEL
jgi:TATA-box binding protein (TBP) (component of TFIID and TFIIIB)